MGHQWLPAVLLLVGGAGGGWFAPHEFHEKVDLTLRVHKQHLDVLQELKRMHAVQFTIDDLHHVHKGTVNYGVTVIANGWCAVATLAHACRIML